MRRSFMGSMKTNRLLITALSVCMIFPWNTADACGLLSRFAERVRANRIEAAQRYNARVNARLVRSSNTVYSYGSSGATSYGSSGATSYGSSGATSFGSSGGYNRYTTRTMRVYSLPRVEIQEEAPETVVEEVEVVQPSRTPSRTGPVRRVLNRMNCPGGVCPTSATETCPCGDDCRCIDCDCVKPVQKVANSLAPFIEKRDKTFLVGNEAPQITSAVLVASL